ncbi:MAG: hypothetical protein V2G33_01635 [bacterium JZ-2024 1]
MNDSSSPLKFGTDGWRGIIGKEFTEESVFQLGTVLGNFLRKYDRFPSFLRNAVVVGFDCRFGSERFARVIARALSSQGLDVMLSDNFCPTPALSFAVVHQKCKAGVMVTASHNPPIYNGVKIRWYHGGAVSDSLITEMLAYTESAVFEDLPRGIVSKTALSDDYLEQVKSLVSPELFHKLSFALVVDYMHGSLAGYAEKLFTSSSIHLTVLRSKREPLFGGNAPEPLEANLAELRRTVLQVKADLGVAFDGDGDRIALVDAEGNYFSVQELLPMLLEHVRRNRGWSLPVGKTYPTSLWVNRVADALGVPIIETRVGFKYLSELLREKKVCIAGEESGGIGFSYHIPERDPLLSLLLYLEKLYYEGDLPVQSRRKFREKYGPLFYQRMDVSLGERAMQNFLSHSEKTLQKWVEILGIQKVNSDDGWKGIINNQEWVMIRPSGTEPVIRVYAESPTREETLRLIEITRKIFLSENNKGG